jgi:hypothetical protein
MPHYFSEQAKPHFGDANNPPTEKSQIRVPARNTFAIKSAPILNQSSLMKKLLTIIALAHFTFFLQSQENYRDFEGIKKVVLAEWNGQMDSTAANTFTNVVNSSAMCAKYIRDTALYDNFKLFPFNKLIDVAPYASAAMGTPKMKIKIYTSAPAGTNIQLQLGIRSNTVYPDGIHSIYTATTTVSRQWEDITFSYLTSPAGGHTVSTDINKIVILFHPNSTDRDTVYFDDPTGPETIPVGLQEHENNTAFKLYQNKPNPAKDNTSIRLQLHTSGHVSLKLYDVLGKTISTLLDQNIQEGLYAIPLETANIPDGVYFYVIKKDGMSQTRRMIISK